MTITLGTQSFFWLKVVPPAEPPVVTSAIPLPVLNDPQR